MSSSNFIFNILNSLTLKIQEKRLSINESSLKIITVFACRLLNRFSYRSVHIYTMDTYLAEVDCTKYLGIVIHKYLKQDQHYYAITRIVVY